MMVTDCRARFNKSFMDNTPMTHPHFTPATLKFLDELSRNNDREWFQANKSRYENHVRRPALEFIEDIAPKLQLIAPRFLALPKKSGGSLMRVYRDTRFGKDKTPYKTNIGIQFRHEAGKDVHAPGYYLHIEPGSYFLGVGIWRPDSMALGKIRDTILEKDEQWLNARDDKSFARTFALDGDSLTNPPRGYPKDHPLMGDLRRKDFIAIKELSKKTVLSPGFLDETVNLFSCAEPFMRFLCAALTIRFD